MMTSLSSLAAGAAEQPPHGIFSSSPASQSQPTILALDLGTSMGWAMSSPKNGIVSGTMSFRPGRYEGGGMRYLRFRLWLNEIHARTVSIDAIYFEEVRRHSGTDAAHIYGGFLAHLSSWCEAEMVAYQGVPVGTIKRFIAGKGNADKQAVIAAVHARGFTPADDNEADALAILLWALENPGGIK